MTDKITATNSGLVANESFEAEMQRPKILYGLPCANCRSYYQSSLATCPLCRCLERISPNSELTRLVAVL